MVFQKGNQVNKGRHPWNYGLTTNTDKRVKKYVDKQKGQKRTLNVSEETRKRQKEGTSKFNKTNNPMWRPEVVFKVSGKNNYNYGKPAWNRGYGDYIKGDRHPNWQGGISHEEYPEEFYLIRPEILERDNYTCQKCNKNHKELYNVHKKDSIIVHHIDFNKNNNKENNLICLCRGCHMRIHWEHHILQKNNLSFYN